MGADAAAECAALAAVGEALSRMGVDDCAPAAT